jgi:hypothetical protein
MKIFVIMMTIFLTTYIKKKHNEIINYKVDDTNERENLNIENFYKVFYKEHKDITIDKKIFLSQDEKNIISLINSLDSKNKYTFRIFGGWVKDKLLDNTPRDIDMAVDCVTMENLFMILEEMFEKLNIQGFDLKDETRFKRPYEVRTYGFTKLILFGIKLDLEVLAADRKVTPPLVKLNDILLS